MSRHFSVLLVEDDDPLRNVLRELLRHWGCAVYSTGRGEQAIDFAKRVPIDFSILDMHLPGMTGVDVFRTINREVGKLPTILISGGATPEETKLARELGMFDFLTKPIEAQSLRRCLETLIDRHFGKPSDRWPLGR